MIGRSRSSARHGVALGLLAVVLLAGCAKQGQPTGGPVDRTAPTVVGHTPASDTTSVALTAPITIDFSEPMERSRVEDAVFVAPKGSLVMEWQGGTQLRIRPRRGLTAGRTYVVTVGTDARDLRGNRMENSYTFAFATGQRLDEGGLLGRVINEDDKPERGAYVWGYDLQDFDGRTGKAEPAYVTQTGADGSYRLERLGAGSYRVIAFVDGNRDQRPDPQEALALPAADIELTQAGMTAGGDLRLARRQPPRVLRASVIDRHRVLLVFDRAVDAADLHVSLGALVVEHVQSDPEDATRVLVRTALQEEGKAYKVQVASGDATLQTPTDPLRGTSRADTKAPTVRRVQPTGIAARVAAVRLLFSEAMDSTRTASWSPTDSTRSPAGNWGWKDRRWLEFVPDEPFAEGKHEMVARLRDLRDRAGNAMKDSTVRVVFDLAPPAQLGAIVGRSVWPQEGGGQGYIRLQPEDGRLPIVTTADTTGRFEFHDLVPGKYVTTAWYDRNGDGHWSAGQLEAGQAKVLYEPAEPFALHGTVTVAAGDVVSLSIPVEPQASDAEEEAGP